MKKLLTLTISMIGAITLFAGMASAHVTVQPQETSQGSYEVFTVRVPSESQDALTTKVEVKFPEEVNVTRFEAKPGWTYTVQKDDTGKITSATWTTEGKGLTESEFVQFNIQGKVGDEATELVWKAYQTYSDGSVVEWVGAPDADKPASYTVVNPADGDGHGHGGTTADSTNDHSAAGDLENDVEAKSATSSVPLFLSIAALVAGLLALFFSLRKRA
ncbi:YcnI family protein [Bacillus sp. ISL-41]|uniref:YcnI family copper-binding membrane protein n=1 Tax=Bacillus sp. ISL-41 TaxID=2819127 RepID=UPI001BE73FEB|nr:YcnI family protein [Bacillus sp. ISL-41]MBT2642897.1 YcnI family protein [Bacillus sp. ISL-41]